MKIIFLDMDGVINNSNTRAPKDVKFGEKEWWISQIETELVSRLNEVIEKTEAKVVISSSWREYWHPLEIQEMLKERGFKGKVIGRTPRRIEIDHELVGDKIGPKLSRIYPRGLEIKQWLIQNRKNYKDKIVIFDDCEDMVDLSDQYIKTSYKTGLTESDVNKAITILNE